MAKMRAVEVQEDEGRTLVWGEAPRPEPGAGEVLVRTRATALNRADVLQRRGGYAPPPGASPILGLEAAGEVAALGEGVEGFAVGDPVCALLEGGGYAEYFVRDARLLLPKPPDMSWQECASLPEVYYTAYVNLKLEAGLAAGERALIHAGASGVGTAAIQLCRAWGNPVLATASAHKLPALDELGVTASFDRRREELFEALAEYTDSMELEAGLEQRGVDVILDPVGAAYLKQNLKLLRTRGRLVLIGLLGGSHGELPLGLVLRRRLRLLGSVLRARSLAEKLDITAKIREEVWPLFEAKELKALVYQEFPIEEAEAAQALMTSNENVGKIVLTVR